MKPDALDSLMRQGEAYHSLRVPPSAYIVVRVDGRSFTRLTGQHYAHPFDERFHAAMVCAAQALFIDMGGLFACTHSDEISVLLPREWDAFSREVEKTASVAAGIASAHFTHTTGIVGAFDGRVWVGPTDEQVIDYLRWRQADSVRGALNSSAYWALRHDGHNARKATAILHEKGVPFKHDLLHGYGINFNELPAWQRRGSILYWEQYTKTGHNPLTGQNVQAIRRRVRVKDDPPAGEMYAMLVRAILLEGRLLERTTFEDDVDDITGNEVHGNSE